MKARWFSVIYTTDSGGGGMAVQAASEQDAKDIARREVLGQGGGAFDARAWEVGNPAVATISDTPGAGGLGSP